MLYQSVLRPALFALDAERAHELATELAAKFEARERGEQERLARQGDTVRVYVKVIEGNKERIQPFEGVVITKRNEGLKSSFTVRKISHSIGVERSFMLHSPRIDRVEVLRYGSVRRAKLYYLREKVGRAARIKEDRNRKPRP